MSFDFYFFISDDTVEHLEVMMEKLDADIEGEAQELPSAFSLFKPSYDALLTNIWTFLGLMGLPVALFIIGGILNGTSGGAQLNANSTFNSGAMVFILGAMILAFITTPAVPYVQLKSAKQETVGIGEALGVGMNYFWRFWGLSILVSLIIIGGFILFIVPGFFMLRRYILSPFYLYDKKLGIIEAMRKSANESRKYSGAIWGLIGVTLLISLPSIFPIIGLISIALQFAYYCAPAIRYYQIRHLQRH